MAWEQLADILREAASEVAADRSRAPQACPNDGEPLTTGPDGVLFCRFDGWRDE